MWGIDITTLSELFLGVLLVLSGLALAARSVKHLFQSALPETPTINKFLKFLGVFVFCVFEFVGVHLIIDPLIPGQATIRVLNNTDSEAINKNIRIEIAPVKFDGSTDLDRVQTGALDQNGTYTAMVKFKWGESRLYLHVYDLTQPTKPLKVDYFNISPYVRLGLWPKDIHIDVSSMP